MLFRICLFVALACSLATAIISFVKVKDVITTTMTERDEFHTKWTTETQAHNKTKATLKKTEGELASTTSKLTQTTSDLEAANTKVADLDKQNTDLTGRLTKTTARADTAEQKLEAWNLTGLTPQQVIHQKGELAKMTQAHDVVVAENKMLDAKAKQLKDQLDTLTGTDEEVIMPTGLKGKVVAVDPKFDFVVLNIGDEQGVKKRGELMVDRQGKLIGKVRITSVEKDRSVANVLPGWQRGDIMEGDQVIY